jgi:hypothetical protein
MRLTTALLALVTCASCVGEVGGGSASRGRTNDPDPSKPKDCERVDDPVTIRTAADLDALPTGCWDLFATLRIDGGQVTSLAGLGELVGVNDLEITGTNLITIDSPLPIDVYGKLTIKNNARLTGLANLNLLREDIPVEITVDNNAALTSLDGVADVTVIDGNLVIANNPRLQAAPLRTLEAVAGATRITSNAELTTIDLSRVATSGSIEIANNAALVNVAPPNATEITGHFILRGNRALTTLGSMSSLVRVVGNVTIDDNDALVNLAAFSTSMQFVTGILTVSNNQLLADVGQLSRLAGIGSITIVSNPSLSVCRAQEVDHCVTQHGAVTIQNNKPDSNCKCWCH